MNRPLKQLFAAGVGLATGWFVVGDKRSPSKHADVVDRPQTISSAAAAEETPAPVEVDSLTTKNAKIATQIDQANTPTELVAIYKKLRKSEVRGTLLWDILIAKLAEADPRLAMRIVHENDRTRVLGKITVSDPQLALELLSNLDEASAKSLRKNFLMTLATSHPRLAIEQIKAANAEGTDHRGAEGNVLQALAKIDPQAALAWFADFPPDRKKDLTHELLAGWMEHSPEDAIAWCLKSADPGLQAWEHPIRSALYNYSMRDPAGAMGALVQFHDRQLIARYADDVFEKAAKASPQKVFDFVESHPELREDLRLLALGSATEELAQKDPALAAEKLDGLSDTHRDNVEVAIVAALAEDDPDAALDWAIAQRPDAPYELIGNLLWGLSHEDPEKAKALLERSFEGDLWDGYQSTTSAVPGIFSHLEKNDPDAAVAWLVEVSNSLPEDVFKRSLALPNVSPAVLDKLITALPDADFSKLVGRMAGERARNEPANVDEWIGTLPEGNMRDDAIANAAIGMAQSDLDLATTWADSLPAGRARQRAINNVAMIYTQFGEPPPLEFILQSGEKERDQLLRLHFALAAQNDPEAASASLKELDLDQPNTEFFQRVIDNPWQNNGDAFSGFR